VEIKKEHMMLMVNNSMDFKKPSRKTKGPKGKSQKGGKSVAAPPKEPKAKPSITCFYCKEEGHSKRYCPKYLEDKKAGKITMKDKGICDIHVIDIYFTSARSNTWVFDTGSIAHICNYQQDLQSKRRLARNEVTMCVGNGSRVDVVVVGTLPLRLLSILILVLNKCYYVPALSMNIACGSRVVRDGYFFKSMTSGCLIYMNNIFYVNAPDRDGLFIFDCNIPARRTTVG
jgi:hypothetical protein